MWILNNNALSLHECCGKQRKHVVIRKVVSINHSKLALWYNRLGLPSNKTTKLVMFSCNIKCDNISMNYVQSVYEACKLGKTHKLPFVPLINKVKASLEIVH